MRWWLSGVRCRGSKHDHYTTWPGHDELTPCGPNIHSHNDQPVTPPHTALSPDFFYTLNVMRWELRCDVMQNADWSGLPPRLAFSNTFRLQVANISVFPKYLFSQSEPASIRKMLILILFPPITARCPECLMWTIINRTIESHLPCFDKSLWCHPADGLISCSTCHLLWLTSPGPGQLGHTWLRWFTRDRA